MMPNSPAAVPVGRPPPPRHARGYGKLYHDQVTQAPDGCDFRFLEAGPPPPEPDIF